MDSKKNSEKYKEIRLSEMLATVKASYDARENKPFELLCDFIMLGTALLLAQAHVAFGVCSLAISLLCAANRRVLPIFIGCLIGAFSLSTGRDGYLLIYSLIFIARIITSMPLRGRVILPRSHGFFQEAPQVRVSVACFAGLGAGIYELIISDFAYYAVLFATGSVLFSAIGAFLFCGVYTSNLSLPFILSEQKPLAFKKINAKSIYTWASIAGLCASVVLALSDKSLFGLNLGLCAISFLSVLFSKKANPVCGAALALIGGAVCDVRYIPSFVILAAVAGITTHLGEIYSLLFGVFLSVIYATTVYSLTGFLDVMPATVIPSLLVWPLFNSKRREGAKTKEEAEDTDAASESSAEQYMRLSRLSSVFSDLSRVFYDASDKTSRPAISEYFGTCDAICNKWCKHCPEKNECWESGDKSAYRAMQGISERLYKRGITDKDCIPASLTRKCPNIDAIVKEIRESCATLTREKHKGDKSALIAFDYEMIAKLLSESAKNDMLDTRKDERLSQELSLVLEKDFNIKVTKLDVCGKRNKKISIHLPSCAPLFECEEAVCERFSQLCESPIGRLALPDAGCPTHVTMQTLPRFSVEFDYAKDSATDREISGDSVCSFKNSDGFSYTILSDGMGSGEEAAFTSDFSNMFLQKMLGATMSKTTSIKMLNNFLRYKDGECSSTVDLFEFDTLTGKASFVKSGAAPSIVKRGGGIFRIKSQTMPIGLLSSIDAEKTDLSLREGDTVIMLSDGISQSCDEKWLLSAIAETNIYTSPKEMATHILKEAKKNSQKADDMTVAVIKISSLLPARDISEIKDSVSAV